MNFPKLVEKKIGATTYKTCDIHGLQINTTDEGTCLLCDRVCRGCGEMKSLALEAAAAGAGYSSDHAHCEKKLDSFWMEKEPEPVDPMLEAKDKRFD